MTSRIRSVLENISWTKKDAQGEVDVRTLADDLVQGKKNLHQHFGELTLYHNTHPSHMLNAIDRHLLYTHKIDDPNEREKLVLPLIKGYSKYLLDQHQRYGMDHD